MIPNYSYDLMAYMDIDVWKKVAELNRSLTYRNYSFLKTVYNIESFSLYTPQLVLNCWA